MFVAEKAYICNMRRWCIKILLIAVLSLVSVFLYEVLWVLVDLDVRRDFINNGIPLDELFFDVRLCTVLTLLSLGYSYLIAKMVKQFVKSIPFRVGDFCIFCACCQHSHSGSLHGSARLVARICEQR